MYYVRTIDPIKETALITLMEGHTVENLIEAFIKECVRRAGSEDALPKAFVPHSNLMVGKFLIERNRDEYIGMMVWGESTITGKPVLCVTRGDRNNNVYIYSPQGKLLKHDTHT